MVTREGMLLFAVIALAPAKLHAATWPSFDPVSVGGRFEYFMHMDRGASPFPWNASSRSAQDRTRLMLDLTASDTTYGSLYVKAAALRDGATDNDADARVRFEQGDFHWSRDRGPARYSLRLFANERRFFVNDMIGPLLDDDLTVRDNRGVRLDVKGAVAVSALYARVGNDFGDARSVAYLRGGYTALAAALSASYLVDDPGTFGGRNHAVFKTELSTAYKRAYAIVSYKQSGFDDAAVFFPRGDFHFDRFDGGNFSSILPEGGALTAEARIKSRPLRGLATVRLVYRYSAAGKDFVNDFGPSAGARVEHTAAAYVRARDVSLDGRLRFRSSTRWRFENEERQTWDAAVWGMLRGGVEFFLRGGVGRVDDRFGFDSERNFVHFALHHRMKKMEGGAHIMWKDLDTIFSERRFAWDGKLALSPDWGLHWRFAAGRGTSVSKAVFSRLEYRPNNRIYAALGYGGDFLGDAPYLLEDRDLDASGPRPAVYTISVRGDF